MKKNVANLSVQHGFRCPKQLANCSDLNCGGDTASQISGRYPSWCVRVTCVKCCKFWHVCKECSPIGKQSNRLTRQHDLKRHNEQHNDANSNNMNSITSTNVATSKKRKSKENSNEHIPVSSPDISNKRINNISSPVQVMSPSVTSISTFGTITSVDPEKFKITLVTLMLTIFLKSFIWYG